VSYHHQNLSDGKLPLWRAGRAWWWKFGWEWHLFRRWGACGVAVGAKHLSIRLPGFQFYLHGRDHDAWEPREFEVSVHDGCLWIEHPWIRGGGEWRSSDPWWKKQIVLHVKDWLLGSVRYEKRDVESCEVFVPMPEGSYRATAKREVATWRRRWYVPKQTRDSWWVDIHGGIPFAGKGENSWDCGDDGLWGTGGRDGMTLGETIGHVVGCVLRSRERRGHDSKGTGRRPAIVLNAAGVDQPAAGGES
jgi:hypothetical protein